MKNSEVEEGKTYVWSSHKPTIGDKGVKVTALALEQVTAPTFGSRPSRRLTMVRVRWEESCHLPAGTEGHVPARELHGDYEAWAAVVDGYRSRREEGHRLKKEITESLVALGLDPEKTQVWPRVGVALSMEIQVRGPEDLQRLSDALSAAAGALDGYAPRG